MGTITWNYTYSFWGKHHRWNQSIGELRVLSNIVTINDLSEVTYLEILEECGGTVEHYHNVLVTWNDTMTWRRTWSVKTLLKKRLRHNCFPVNFAKIFRTPIHRTHLGNYFWCYLFSQSFQTKSPEEHYLRLYVPWRSDSELKQQLSYENRLRFCVIQINMNLAWI